MSPWRPPRVPGERLPVHLVWFRAGLLFWMVVLSAVGSLALLKSYDDVHAIQHSRLDNCLAQNQRHARTIHTLNVEIARLIQQAPPAKRAAVAIELRASKSFTVALINDLQPHLDCTKIIG